MSEYNLTNRTIFCADNLDILQNINSSCIDLIYLDPPFNTKKRWLAPIGSSADGATFDDIFREEDVKDEWIITIQQDNEKLHSFLHSIKIVDGKPAYNYCYLCYMAIRLIEMHRILKDTGAIYLHCDQTMSHYLKIVMDCIFGEKMLVNEIIWQRASKKAKGSQYAPKSFGADIDCILAYSKTKEYKLSNTRPLTDKAEILKKFPLEDERGRYNTKTPIFCSQSMKPTPTLCYEYKGVRNPYPSGWRVEKKVLEQMDADGLIIWQEGKTPLRKSYEHMYKGVPLGNLWLDIPHVTGKEDTGYPTQKPIKLLERIIAASSDKGDIVLDPFCGCATTCIAAERSERKWVGIDVSLEAFKKVQTRAVVEIPSDLLDVNRDINCLTSAPKRTDQGDDDVLKKYVYIISNPKMKAYKVGIAKNWKQRLNSYQTADSDRSYKIEYKLLTTKFMEIEKHIHGHFNASHEWVSADLKEIIAKIKEYENDL